MKYGICGGTYDPVHLGHLYIWYTAIEKLNLDYLFIIPNYISPLKENKHFSDDTRYKLLELAMKDYKDIYKDNSKLVLLDYEIKRETSSYTFNTINYLYEKYDFKTKPYFIIGSDTSRNLDKWYKIEDLFNLVTFAIMPRKNYDTILTNDSILLDVKPYVASSTSFRKNKNFDILSKRVRKYVKAL